MKKYHVIKWIALIVFIIIVAFVGFLTVILFDELRTAASVKTLATGNVEENAGNVYSVDIVGDYYLDDYVEQGGVKNDNELINFLIKKMSNGIVDIDIDISKMACTGIAAESLSGSRFFARNYDMNTITNIAVVKTKPGNGRYASIAISDLQMVAVSKTKGITSLFGKLMCSISPYVCVDGINEAGLAGGVFSSHQEGGANQNTDKPDTPTTVLFRMMLDYCGSVDEAVELAKSYDYHDSISMSFHIMVADSTGKSAIIEWVNGTQSTDKDAGDKRKMVVTYNDDKNYQVVTNFVNYPNFYEAPLDSIYSYDRYRIVSEMLDSTDGLTSESGIYDILEGVSRGLRDDGEITVHTVVYNLKNKTMTLIDNENYDDPAHTFRFSFDDLI